MFSLFKKKKELSVRVRTFDAARYLAGMQIITDRHGYKRDVSQLQQEFYSKREALCERTAPRATMVLFGNEDSDGRFSYFIGDLVDSQAQEESFTVVELAPGDYAHITVGFKVPNDLALSVAKRKQQFYSQWLPESGYRVPDAVESIELYDRRSEIDLPSIDLVFPLVKA